MAKRAFDNVLELERRAQRPVIQAFEKFQKRMVNFFKPPNVQPVPPPPAPTLLSGTISPPANPVDVNGFYMVTSPTEVTFYVTSNTTPRDQVGRGWTVVGVTGIKGQLQVSGADLNMKMEPRVKKVSDSFSESYIWSFTLQSDTDQSLPDYQYSTGTILYPPEQVDYIATKRSAPIYGRYDVIQNVTTFIFSNPPIAGFGPGWTVENLPGFDVPLRVVSFTDFGTQVEEPSDEDNKAKGRGRRYYLKSKSPAPAPVINMFAILAPIDGSIPENTTTTVYVRGFPAITKEPNFVSKFVPGKFVQQTNEAEVKKFNIEINPKAIGGNAPPLRDLNSGFECQPPEPGPYDDVKGLGFSTGSLLGLFAVGPQEEYLTTNDFSKSQWNPEFKRYTNSVMYQRVIPFPPANPYYQNQTIQLELLPTELGHLLSNMYLKVTMPALATGYQYTSQLGRALIKQVDLLVNETVVETLYDDWYIVRDQLFLDADEQTGMFQAVGSSNINSQVATDYIIPLEFFFCRRKSHNDSGNERLRRPYFPLCAMWNQRLYVRFTFHPNTWWCNVAAPHTTDLILPKLVTEEILLDNAEKLYYQNTPLRYIVNRVKKESTLTFSAGNPQLQLTASFPVQTLAWFFRNKNYEDTTSGLYSDSRYSYGYTTQYIQTGIQLKFPSGPSNYIDVIDNAKITLNNVDILSTFQGSLYYTFKQPLEHGLSIPSKNIYTYSFGLTPKEYNQGGYLNFSKLNSQTTTLTLVFNPSYASQITQGYNLYMFYYGYTLLEFQGGFARLPFV
jgi:hypothetical protein